MKSICSLGLFFFLFVSKSFSQTSGLQMIGMSHDFVLKTYIKEYKLFKDDYLLSEFVVTNTLHYAFLYTPSLICYAFVIKTIDEETKQATLKMILAEGSVIDANESGVIFKWRSYYVHEAHYDELTDFTFTETNVFK